MEEKLKVVKPYGLLYTTLETYYLLSPEPIVKDSWQGDNCYRFVVTPIMVQSIEQKGNEVTEIHGYARHVVTNDFTIEYRYNLPEINIGVLDEFDLTKLEYQKEIEEDDKEDEFPF